MCKTFLFHLKLSLVIFKIIFSSENYMYYNLAAQSKRYNGVAYSINFGGTLDQSRLFISDYTSAFFLPQEI